MTEDNANIDVVSEYEWLRYYDKLLANRKNKNTENKKFYLVG